MKDSELVTAGGTCAPENKATDEQSSETPHDAEILRRMGRELRVTLSPRSAVVTITGQTLKDFRFYAEFVRRDVRDWLGDAILGYAAADAEAANRNEEHDFYRRAAETVEWRL